MRTGVIVKLVILFFTLALVVWASIAVREGSMEGFFVSLTGGDDSKQINICRNRIHSLTLESGKKIEESHTGGNSQWKAYDPDPRLLNYMAIEKWLAEHCYIEATELEQTMEQLGSFQNAVKIMYIDESETSLMQNSANPNVYSWDGRFYESAEMTTALAELNTLAGW